MRKRGYALPLSLCVAGVTLMLGLSAAQMTNGDLGLANHQYYQERARQMADFGLEYCVSHPIAPGASVPLNSLSATHPFDSVSVQMYRWDTPGAPVEVPKGFEYWVAEGHAGEHAGASPLASARVGAMVCFGTPTGSAGAQVRSLHISSAQPVDFIAWDGLSGQQVFGESVLSSDYDGGVSPPLPFPGQNHVIDLDNVGTFTGTFKIPKGVDKSVVHFKPGPSVTVTTDGGPMNVPTFSPPSGLPFVNGLALGNDFDGSLPPGHYGTLEISPSANVHLNGTYHFDHLKLSGDTALDQGGTLRVDNNDSAKVFVSKIELGQGSLGLTNDHGSAQNFRFTVQVSRPVVGTPDPLLNFKLYNGGGVALVADGYRIRLESDSSREIRGAFSARALEAKFPNGNPFGAPKFIYDVSATTARRSTKGVVGVVTTNDGVNTGTDGSTTSSSGNTGNAGNSNSSSDGGDLQDESGNSNSDDQGSQGSLTPKAGTGLEPMILSRQPL